MLRNSSLRRSPMKRSPFGVKLSRPKLGMSNPDAATVEMVLARASARGHLYCEVCSDRVTGTRGLDWALHHRRGRDGKPDSHTAPNLLVVHGPDNVTACHGRIHRNRAGEAQDFGWLIKRNGVNTNPLRIPVLVDRESRWVYLTAAGTYADEPEGGLWLVGE